MVTNKPANDSIQTISLTHRQLWMVRAALEEYLAIFGHQQGNIVDEIKSLLRSLPTVDGVDSGLNATAPRSPVVKDLARGDRQAPSQIDHGTHGMGTELEVRQDATERTDNCSSFRPETL